MITKLIRDTLFNLLLTVYSFILLAKTLKLFALHPALITIEIITYLSFVGAVLLGLLYGYSGKHLTKANLEKKTVTIDYDAKIGSVMITGIYFMPFYLAFFGFRQVNSEAFLWLFILSYLFFNALLLAYAWISIAMHLKLYLKKYIE